MPEPDPDQGEWIPVAEKLKTVTGDPQKDEKEWKDDASRTNESKEVVFQSLQGVVRVISNIVILAIAAIAWHYLLPVQLSWLSDKQIQGLLTFLLSSVVVGSVSKYFHDHA